MSLRIRLRYVALVVVLVAPLGLVLVELEQRLWSQPRPQTPPGSYQDAEQVNRAGPDLQPADAGKPLQCRITGPFTHQNLSIFLLHGPDQIQLQKFWTVPEALEQKLFVIHETQSVNQLQMENLSPDAPVIILAGDILKGGQQDRIAQADHIVPPKSGKLPLPAYCVERTAPRWMTQLTGENSTFGTS